MFTTTKKDSHDFDIKKMKAEAKSAITTLSSVCSEFKNQKLVNAIESFLQQTEITGYEIEEMSDGGPVIKKYYLLEHSGLFHIIENFSEFITNLLAEGLSSDLQEFQYTSKLSACLQKEKAAIECCLDKRNVNFSTPLRFACEQLIAIVKQCEAELMLQKQKFIAEHEPKPQSNQPACT